VQISQREIEQAPLARDAPVTPVRTSVWGAGQPARNAPPPAVVNRQVVARRASPPAPAAPFSPKQVESNRAWGSQQPAPQPVQQPVQPRGEFRQEPVTPAQQPAPPLQQPRVMQPAPSAGMERGTKTEALPANPPARQAQVQAPPHPLVKPAPPVQEKTPQQQQQEENKQRAWQEQRGKPTAPATPRPDTPHN